MIQLGLFFKMALYGRTESVSFVCPSTLLNYLEVWRVYALHELLAFSVEVFLRGMYRGGGNS